MIDISISILIVSWNVRELLLQCLAAIPAAVGDNLNYEVFVVDNASSDGTPDAVKKQFPGVNIIANPANRGFTGGNNQALARARGRYLFLLNPDTEPCPGSVAELHRYLADNPSVGIVGPRLRYGDGNSQPSRRRFPTIAILFTESTIIQHYLPGLTLFDRYYMKDQSEDLVQQVDWLVGAALFARRQVYEQSCGLDEGFFMYSEELDWCHRAVDAGWEIAYNPAAEIIHHEGKSSEQVVAARHIHFFSSRVRYTQKYHGRFWATVLRAWLLVTFVLQWIREAVKWLAGHKRPLRAKRMAAYQQVLQSGLRSQ